jgi:MFS family permease
VGLLAMIKALPALVLGALAGVFVDRWSRKWIMVLSNLALFALVFAIPLVPGLPLVFGVYFAMSVVSQFFIPARSATIPNLVPGGALVAANALFAAAFVGAIAIGPAIGGWIIDRYGLETAFYIDAITFLAPAVAVGLLAIPSGVRQASRRNMGADWREGFGLVKTESTFRTALILLASASLVIAALSTLGIVIVREKLGGSPGDFGWMMSVSGLGMLSGALLSTRLGTRFDSQRLASCGAGLAGVGLLGMALSPILPLVMGFGFVLGVGMITVQVQTQTTLQGAPDALRGRMLGIAQSVMGSMTFLIAGLAGLLAARFGATLVVLMCGLLAAGTGLAVFASSAQRG